MSKILRALLFAAYGALIIQFLNTFRKETQEPFIELNYVFKTPGLMKRLERERKKLRNNTITEFDYHYRPPERLPTDFKFILKLTERFYEFRSEAFHRGQRAFLEENCEYTNCYFTYDAGLLMDVRNFDAVVFDYDSFGESPPVKRSPHQKYIFAALESNQYSQMCDPFFDNYFNLTWSFRLDSDVVWSYFKVLDSNRTQIGPRINVTWLDEMYPTTNTIITKLAKKQKMAAWFVSDCNAKSDRMNMSYQIQNHLQLHGWAVDIFGRCGSLACPKDNMDECFDLLQREYYYYFAFENSKDEDYVSEKVLHALLHYTVPVVYGGANYSRFLPPGSYIDAGKLKPYATASLMVESISTFDKRIYYDFFRWHSHYIVEETREVSDVCDLCKLLNTKPGTTIKQDFRTWWNPNFRKECSSTQIEQKVEELEKLQNMRKKEHEKKIKENIIKRKVRRQRRDSY